MYLDDQHGEVVSVARRGAPGRSPSPAITRRSCGWRRTASGVHGCVNLANKKMSQSVQEMRKGEEMREGEKREARVVGGRPETNFSPAASCGWLELLRGSLAAIS